MKGWGKITIEVETKHGTKTARLTQAERGSLKLKLFGKTLSQENARGSNEAFMLPTMSERPSSTAWRCAWMQVAPQLREVWHVHRLGGQAHKEEKDRKAKNPSGTIVGTKKVDADEPATQPQEKGRRLGIGKKDKPGRSSLTKSSSIRDW